MLNPMMPAEIASKPVARQPLPSIFGVFKLRQVRRTLSTLFNAALASKDFGPFRTDCLSRKLVLLPLYSSTGLP